MWSVPEVTRLNIGRAALGVFSARGYSAATLAQIGAEVGLTRGAVLHHFHSKEELLNTVVEPYQQALTELVVTARTDDLPTDRQRAQVVAGLVDLLIEHRDAVRVLAADVSARRQLGQHHWPFPPAAVTSLLTGGRSTPLTRLQLAAAFGALTSPLASPDIDFDDTVTRQELVAVVTAVLDREQASTPAPRSTQQAVQGAHRPATSVGAGAR